MAINNDEAVTVPAVVAVPEKTYPHLWLTDIHVQAKTNTQGSLSIEAVPYNGDTGEVADNTVVDSIYTEDLWTAVQEVPEVAIAMQAIFNAVEPLKAWIAENEV